MERVWRGDGGTRGGLEGVARITGATVERVLGRASGEPEPVESPAQRRRRHLRALVHYRQMLGITGRERVREDGRVVRRGMSAKMLARLESGQGVRRGQLLRQLRHFTDGVILGSRTFVDEWFGRNREWFRGRSRTERKTGARSIGKGWEGIFNLRQLRVGIAKGR